MPGLASCAALRPAEPILPEAAPTPPLERIRVTDERGGLGPKQFVATLQRLSSQASSDFLVRHLSQGDAAMTAQLVDGNAARLLIDGPETHEAMFAAIAGARDHINLETYMLEPSGVGERLAAVLVAKRAAGV